MKLDNVKHIGIIGLGMIGDSLAVLTTGHGYKTTCVARREVMIPEYKKTYDNYFRQMIDKGLMPENQLSICEKYLKYTLDITEIADCEVIFECINNFKCHILLTFPVFKSMFILCIITKETKC